jgi:hypothetical protein
MIIKVRKTVYKIRYYVKRILNSLVISKSKKRFILKKVKKLIKKY